LDRDLKTSITGLREQSCPDEMNLGKTVTYGQDEKQNQKDSALQDVGIREVS
jgi:hypothetical protein